MFIRIFKNVRYIVLAFRCNRILTAGIIMLRVSSAVVPPLQTLAIAGLLDTLPSVIATKNVTGAFMRLAVIFAVLLANYLIQVVSRLVILRFNMSLENKLKPELVDKINRLAYKHIEFNETYDLLERVGEDLPAAVQNGFMNLLDIAEIIISITGLIVIIGSSSILSALACLLLVVPVVIIARKSGTEAYEASAQIVPFARKAKYYKYMLSSRETALERTLFGFSTKIGKYWNTETDQKIKLDYKADKKIFIRSKSISIVFVLLLIVMTLLLLLLVKSGSMTTGICISLIISLSALIHTFSWQLSRMLSQYTKNQLFVEDLVRVECLTEVPESDLNPDVRINDMPFKSLVFDHVSFIYPQSEREVLHDFSLEIYPGKQYAFVGKNGCGKSTVVKLLTGLYQEYSGSIILNGRDINLYSSAERKAYFAVLYQEYAKYQLTLKEQLRLGNPDLTDIQIDGLLEQMGIAEKARSLPRGTDTPLGKLEPESVDLSGGQWQLVALARSFGRKANLFIFDEPAAALDVFAENQLYETIRRYGTSDRMTTLYITHRLAAARLADEIIVMDKGRVVEQGTHDALLAKRAYYAEMFATQAKWYREHKGEPE